jgi:hypothetical protein
MTTPVGATLPRLRRSGGLQRPALRVWKRADGRPVRALLPPRPLHGKHQRSWETHRRTGGTGSERVCRRGGSVAPRGERVERSTGLGLLATSSVLAATGLLILATCWVDGATCSFRRPICSVGQPTGSPPLSKGSFPRFPGSPPHPCVCEHLDEKILNAGSLRPLFEITQVQSSPLDFDDSQNVVPLAF